MAFSAFFASRGPHHLSAGGFEHGDDIERNQRLDFHHQKTREVTVSRAASLTKPAAWRSRAFDRKSPTK